MAQHTERQLQAWICWLNEDMNNPSRSDHYLMQIAAEVRTVLMNAAETKKVKLSQFEIPFETKKVKREEVKKPPMKAKIKAVAAAAKSRWFAITNYKGDK